MCMLGILNNYIEACRTYMYGNICVFARDDACMRACMYDSFSMIVYIASVYEWKDQYSHTGYCSVFLRTFQLRTRDGEFVPATPMDGVVLVNVGDQMQRWTSDKLVSTVSWVLSE